MKFKRKVPYIVVILMVLIYLAVLTTTSLSNGTVIADIFAVLSGHPKVRFTDASFDQDAQSIAIPLREGEVALLDQFTDLQSADFSGSVCYDDIISWKNAHPNVNVVYTVTMPNGQNTAFDATSLNLSGLTHEQTDSAAALLKYLPNINSIDFGSSADSASPITSDDLEKFKSLLPESEIKYRINFLGNEYSLDDTVADLGGMTSDKVNEAVGALKFLKNLDTIKIGQDATVNGSLQWSDISAVANAFPNAAMEYEFTVLGKKATMSDESLDLREMKDSDLDTILQILPGMSKLTKLETGPDISEQTLTALAEAASNATFDYALNIYGKEVNLSDTVWDFNHTEVGDSGEEVRKWAKYARNLTVIDMDSCGVSNEKMAEIRDELPGVDVIWRINFGDTYSVRTNVTKILASKPSKGGVLHDDGIQVLKYCTNVHYLDLGHNEEISDFSFVESMPELEIVVLSMTKIRDFTPFSKCTHLKYIECGNTPISDLSPLAECKELKHLNVGTCSGVKDISCLYDLNLKRLWLGVGDPVPADQVKEMSERHPDCIVNITASTGMEKDSLGNLISEGYTADGWKYWQQYLTVDWDFFTANHAFPAQRPLGWWKVAYKAFQYNLGEKAYAFSWNDPKYEVHEDGVAPVNTYLVDVSLLSEDWKDPESLTADVLEDEPGNIIFTGEY